MKSVFNSNRLNLWGASTFLVGPSWHPGTSPTNSNSHKILFSQILCKKIYFTSLSSVNCVLFVRILTMHLKIVFLIQTYWRSSFLVDLSWQPTITPARSNVPSITVHIKLYFCSFVLGFCSFFFVFLLILLEMFCNCIVQFLDSI